MKQFRIVPKITICTTAGEFCSEFKPCTDDLVFMGKSTENYFAGKLNGAHVIFRSDYGRGEPTDIMVEKIYDDVKDIPYKRVIAVGGGTIVDAAKLLALRTFHPVPDLYDKKIPALRDKELIIIPTTCGTGSEVTNISILELTARGTKMGLADDALFADHAVLIPELLTDLPYRFFATSSIDALVHATESYLSPKATAFSRTFSIKAAEMILTGYMQIREHGPDARLPLMEQFLLAGTYAGIAFGNAGTGAVHAMSYSFGAKYHVPHGEANYALYTAVFKKYQSLAPEGDIRNLNRVISSIIKCSEQDVYTALEELLGSILERKPLRAYGTTESDLTSFTDNTMTKQGRLTANNYCPLNAGQVLEIYSSVY
ncbi:MAG: 4-hydroxybutyrate dehydrogenase [Treponema sp.]|nr:4-hydroxybutyrate dehydrogenase [Treponema sp.]